ncbi:MAG: hypothetical protein AB7G80_05815 [Dongiaceae bacterium]
MNAKNLRLVRNFLLKTFVIGIAFTLLMGWATVNGWAMWTGLASTWFHTDAATLTPLVLEFFMNVRFFLLFIVLAPALAIHWMLHKELA